MIVEVKSSEFNPEIDTRNFSVTVAISGRELV